MCKLYENIRIIALGCLCLVFVGCSSYAPYRYSFSLIEPQNENLQNDVVEQVMSFEIVKSGSGLFLLPRVSVCQSRTRVTMK